jgi:hypothetical protein
MSLRIEQLASPIIAALSSNQNSAKYENVFNDTFFLVNKTELQGKKIISSKYRYHNFSLKSSRYYEYAIRKHMSSTL